MLRFPILNLYRTLFYGAAGLVILAGIFIGTSAGDDYSLTIIIAAVFAAGSFILSAELIKLGLFIEDHLYNIRYSLQTGASPSKENLAASYRPAPAARTAPSAAQRAAAQPVGPKATLTGTVRATQTTVRQKPDWNGAILISLTQGQTVRVAKRTEDCKWLKVDDPTSDSWVFADHFTFRDSIMALAVFAPTPETADPPELTL